MQNKFQVHFNYYSNVNEFQVKPFQTNKTFPTQHRGSLLEAGRELSAFTSPGGRFSHLCNIEGGEGTAFCVHTRGPLFKPPFTCVLPYPCAHVQDGSCSPSQPPLSLFFSPSTRDCYHFLKKIARVYVKCHPTSQLSQLVPLKASGKKTASVDLTVKTSLSCVFLVLFGFGFVSLSSDS